MGRLGRFFGGKQDDEVDKLEKDARMLAKVSQEHAPKAHIMGTGLGAAGMRPHTAAVPGRPGPGGGGGAGRPATAMAVPVRPSSAGSAHSTKSALKVSLGPEPSAAWAQEEAAALSGDGSGKLGGSGRTLATSASRKGVSWTHIPVVEEEGDSPTHGAGKGPVAEGALRALLPRPPGTAKLNSVVPEIQPAELESEGLRAWARASAWGSRPQPLGEAVEVEEEERISRGSGGPRGAWRGLRGSGRSRVAPAPSQTLRRIAEGEEEGEHAELQGRGRSAGAAAHEEDREEEEGQQGPGMRGLDALPKYTPAEYIRMYGLTSVGPAAAWWFSDPVGGLLDSSTSEEEEEEEEEGFEDAEESDDLQGAGGAQNVWVRSPAGPVGEGQEGGEDGGLTSTLLALTAGGLESLDWDASLENSPDGAQRTLSALMRLEEEPSNQSSGNSGPPLSNFNGEGEGGDHVTRFAQDTSHSFSPKAWDMQAQGSDGLGEDGAATAAMLASAGAAAAGAACTSPAPHALSPVQAHQQLPSSGSSSNRGSGSGAAAARVSPSHGLGAERPFQPWQPRPSGAAAAGAAAAGAGALPSTTPPKPVVRMVSDLSDGDGSYSPVSPPDDSPGSSRPSSGASKGSGGSIYEEAEDSLPAWEGATVIGNKAQQRAARRMGGAAAPPPVAAPGQRQPAALVVSPRAGEQNIEDELNAVFGQPVASRSNSIAKSAAGFASVHGTRSGRLKLGAGAGGAGPGAGEEEEDRPSIAVEGARPLPNTVVGLKPCSGLGLAVCCLDACAFVASQLACFCCLWCCMWVAPNAPALGSPHLASALLTITCPTPRLHPHRSVRVTPACPSPSQAEKGSSRRAPPVAATGPRASSKLPPGTRLPTSAGA